MHEPETVSGWERYLNSTECNALFILGDLFDAWIGDDAIAEHGSFERQCADILRLTANQRLLFFMPGNRDFLIGLGFYDFCSVQGLSDPTLFCMGEYRWLLSHGDLLCLDDVPYQEFRLLVRSEAWQEQFLSQSLSVRREQARSIRAASESHKKSVRAYVDIDTPEALLWMGAYNATALIHGHTHKPADHLLPNGMIRHVLSDWDLGAHPARAEVLRISQTGVERINLAHI